MEPTREEISLAILEHIYAGQHIANAKTTDKRGNSAAWEHRAAEEREITTRRGFLDKILYGFVQPTTTEAQNETKY